MSAALSFTFIAVLSVAATEGGDITDPDVRQAIQAYDALSYGNVVPLLRRALARPELSQADRRAALAYLGRAHAIFREPRESEATFLELLHLDPSFTPSAAESPLIREAHARALERFLAAGGARSTPPAKDPEAPLDTRAVTEPLPEERAFDPLWVYGGVGAAVVVTAVLVIWRPWASELPSGSLGTWSLP